jgi:hypothetical protein
MDIKAPFSCKYAEIIQAFDWAKGSACHLHPSLSQVFPLPWVTKGLKLLSGFLWITHVIHM